VQVGSIVKLYTRSFAMRAEKNISISFRVSPLFKRLLEASAAREHRSQTNMLEALLFAYCDEHDVADSPETHAQIGNQVQGAT
jgi:hypothetical protein